MYYVCVYSRGEKWWLRDVTSHLTYDAADAAREKIIEALGTEVFTKFKCEVWPRARWDHLAIGFKHPDLRTESDKERARRSETTPEVKKFRNFNELETDLAQALREAGL